MPVTAGDSPPASWHSPCDATESTTEYLQLFTFLRPLVKLGKKDYYCVFIANKFLIYKLYKYMYMYLPLVLHFAFIFYLTHGTIVVNQL